MEEIGVILMIFGFLAGAVSACCGFYLYYQEKRYEWKNKQVLRTRKLKDRRQNDH